MSAGFMVGDRVRLKSQPPYLKTADTMPMLRPGDIIPVGSQGVITQQKPGGYWTVKFERGAFLVDSSYLEKVTGETAGTSAPA
jgi:hypothetical protein